MSPTRRVMPGSMLYLKYEVDDKTVAWHPCVVARVLGRGRGRVRVLARHFDGCPATDVVLKDGDFGESGASDEAWTFMAETSATAGRSWFAVLALAVLIAIVAAGVVLLSAHPDIVEPYVKRLLTLDETW